MSIEIPKNVKELVAYQSGKPIEEVAREKGLKRIVKLASNENPLGPSPKAVQAIQEYATQIHRYPDTKAFDLAETLSEKFGIPSSCFICGNGSDALIAYAMMALLSEEDELLISEGTFIGAFLSAKKLNRKVRRVSLRNYHTDLRQIHRSIDSKTKMIYLANPNNPTGAMFSRAAFEAFLQKVPPHVVVILDEAYTLFASDNSFYPNGIEYLQDGVPNLLVMRTLSKDYGLAGVRIGYCAGDTKLVDAMFRVRHPFEPSLLAQVAAKAALLDDEHLAKTKELNEKSLKMLMRKCHELGIEFMETSANFLMLTFPTDIEAKNFNERCLSRGLILRHLGAFGITNAIRINSGTLDETEFALEVLEDVHRSKSDKTLSELPLS